MSKTTPKKIGPRAAPRPQMSDGARHRVQEELASDRDETNPAFLYSTTATSLLLAIAGGLIDPVAIARQTLANRGLDRDGAWVGFDRAVQIHGVTR